MSKNGELDKAIEVSHNFLRYTFGDVIYSRFRAKLTHTADAALVASSSWVSFGKPLTHPLLFLFFPALLE